MRRYEANTTTEEQANFFFEVYGNSAKRYSSLSSSRGNSTKSKETTYVISPEPVKKVSGEIDRVTWKLCPVLLNSFLFAIKKLKLNYLSIAISWRVHTSMFNVRPQIRSQILKMNFFVPLLKQMFNHATCHKTRTAQPARREDTMQNACHLSPVESHVRSIPFLSSLHNTSSARLILNWIIIFIDL